MPIDSEAPTISASRHPAAATTAPLTTSPTELPRYTLNNTHPLADVRTSTGATTLMKWFRALTHHPVTRPAGTVRKHIVTNVVPNTGSANANGYANAPRTRTLVVATRSLMVP